MKTTSGFTEDINKEMNVADPQPVVSKFSNLSQCYVSISGHTRIFTATRYGKRYMLKCLKNDFLYTPIYRQALTKEFEIGLLLEHPNICHTIGMEEVENLGTTIVMEYIDGDTLQYLIDQQLLTAEMAHKIAHELMDALEYMHNKQMIHRDLKPANIMVTHNGKNVKLIDFDFPTAIPSPFLNCRQEPRATSPRNNSCREPNQTLRQTFIRWAWCFSTWRRPPTTGTSGRWQKYA